jgi:hypothetical protein
MPRVLNIQIRPIPLAREIARTQEQCGVEVVDVDLTDPGQADYELLLEEIFRADSVIVW